jgi:hypothetical protein
MTVLEFSFEQPAHAEAMQWLRTGWLGTVRFVGLKTAERQGRQWKRLAQLC